MNTLFVGLSLSFPAFFAGIRYGIGVDYFSYVRIFNNVNNGYRVRTESGFSLINLIIGKLGGNEQIMFFVVSYLTFLFIYLAIKKYENTLSLGLCMLTFMLFYYNISFNLVRMTLSISIMLYSFDFIYEKKAIKFLASVCLAISIHNSSIVMLPFYFLFNNISKKNKLFKFVVYLFIIIMLFNYDILISFVSVNILKTNYYLHYIAESNQTSFGIGLFIINAPFILPGIIFYKRLVKIDERFSLIFFMINVGFILKFTGYIGAKYLNRISDVFFIAVVLIVPFYYKLFKEKTNSFIIGPSLILYIIIYWGYLYIYLASHQTVPYTTIFS
ncbi:EpsG family protein [Tissierella sp.]